MNDTVKVTLTKEQAIYLINLITMDFIMTTRYEKEGTSDKLAMISKTNTAMFAAISAPPEGEHDDNDE